ncbi:putative DDB1- and CUL4-associated factor 5 [Apostichopus japonicus]|uniref:Putative DDB1-and CUL4-associated factor 5 n=2 Tax=Stichopus japonicus TaxID=307972 RepID=A0A2G8LE44_STIJA|nr:putative DDB1- and CUL4-associated factor 5 [Apostichopus japonicus]
MAGKTDSSRRMFTHQQYFDMMINSNSTLSHDYSHQSTQEDPHMLAFFDSLIQREVERSISSDSDDSDDISPASMFLDFVQNSDSESTESGRGDVHSASDDSDSSSDDERTYLTLTKGTYDQGVKTKQQTTKTIPKSPHFEMRTHHQPNTSSIPGSSKEVKRRESSSEDTSTSQSSGDVFIMKLKSKLFQKITRRRKRSKKVKEIPGKSRFKKSKQQEESDRLTNLRQRTAFCKVLKERMPESSDTDSDSNEVVDEVLKTLANSFNHRTDVARQRGAALRIKKLQIANEAQQLQRFQISDRGEASRAGSSVSGQHESEVRISNPEGSINGVGSHRTIDKEDTSHSHDSSIPKVNDSGQRSSCSDDLAPSSSSSHIGNQNKDNHFKKMKGSKKKNYRTKRKGSDS